MTVVITRRERKKNAARTRILAAAIELFSSNGFESVTIDQIADSADVGKGTIYNYFATKNDIVVAFLADLEGRLADSIAAFTPGEEPLDQVLSGYLLLHFRLKERYHEFVRVFLARMFTDTACLLPYMLEMQKYTDPPLQSLFKTLEERGLLRTGVNLAEIVLAFKTLQLGLTALWAIEGPPFAATIAAARNQMQFFTQGIMRKAT